MKIQIFGTGCRKCQKLAEATEAAAQELQLDYEIEKVTELSQIMAMGVIITPALAVDGSIKSSGKIPSADELKNFLSE